MSVGAFKTIPNFLIFGGSVFVIAAMASAATGEIEGVLIAGLSGVAMIASGILVNVAKRKAAALLARRRDDEVAHEQRLNIARAHGAEPGQLMVAPPDDAAGDLSLSHRPGAVSLAKKQPQ